MGVVLWGALLWFLCVAGVGCVLVGVGVCFGLVFRLLWEGRVVLLGYMCGGVAFVLEC